MALIDEARKLAGEVFIIGFDGTELSDDTAAFLSQAGIGGVILFTRNYESPEQIARLSNQVQECRAELPLWISVDQEGGRVQRFREPFTIIPPALSIAEKGSPKLLFDIAEITAKELHSVGVNLNYAPVCDILTNGDNPAIGDRAYGRSESDVSKLVTAVVRGHLTNGVQACAKHFPGHGDTSVDSHDELPTVDTPLETLREREFRPFVRTSKSRCTMTMVAHVVCTAVDSEKPASLSRKVIQDVLRGELRYSRIVVSDDMEMQAITSNFGVEEAPVLALDAGCDLLIYRTEKTARHAYESVIAALDEGRLDPQRVIDSAGRSRALKNEVLTPYQPVDPAAAAKTVGCEEHQAVVGQLGE